jgi:hypothetical protein
VFSFLCAVSVFSLHSVVNKAEETLTTEDTDDTEDTEI